MSASISHQQGYINFHVSSKKITFNIAETDNKTNQFKELFKTKQ